MAKRETEVSFTAGFWKLAAEQHPNAVRIMSNVKPDDLENEDLGRMYSTLTQRVAKGQSVDPQEDVVGLEFLSEFSDEHGEELVGSVWGVMAGLKGTPQMGGICRSLLDSVIARKQVSALRASTMEVVDRLAVHNYQGVHDLAHDLAMQLYAMGAKQPGRARISTRGEITERLLLEIDAESPGGVVWPYPKMTKALGLLSSGDVVGLTAQPGAGKTTMLANLFIEWTKRGVPCICFSTEMRLKFLNRAYAAAAGIPQIVAEQGLFNTRDPRIVNMLADLWGCDQQTAKLRMGAYADQYREVVREWEHYPWEVVDLANLTPEQLLGHTRILRRRYAGQHVILMADHMLNLDYGEVNFALGVGPATKGVKDLCQDDDQGGLSAVLLFQAKKDTTERQATAALRPVSAGEIPGRVHQVLDRHFSLYLMEVETTYGLTEWGTKRTAYDERGFPLRAKSDSATKKIDDEHILLKVDKNRTGGPSPTQVLDFHAPSGRVYELDRVHSREPAAR